MIITSIKNIKVINNKLFTISWKIIIKYIIEKIK